MIVDIIEFYMVCHGITLKQCLDNEICKYKVYCRINDTHETKTMIYSEGE